MAELSKNIFIFTNNFMSPPNLFPEESGDDYFEYNTLVLDNITDFENSDIAQQPVLVSKQIFSLTLERINYRDKPKIAKLCSNIHKDNILMLNCTHGSALEVSQILEDVNIKVKIKNLNFADLEPFVLYCNMHGYFGENKIQELHKRLFGKLSSSLTYIMELNMGTNINRLIVYEGRANYTNFIGFFLGLTHSKRDAQFFFRVLRREHPNYMRAILASQLKMLIKMKSNQKELTFGLLTTDDIKVDRRFGKTYFDKLALVSLPTLYQVKKDLKNYRMLEADILLLKMKYDRGGYVPPIKEEIRWT